MIKLQTGVPIKAVEPDNAVVTVGFPSNDNAHDHPTYIEMATARVAFLRAWRSWLVQARPAATATAEEADGTASAMRQFSAALAGGANDAG